MLNQEAAAASRSGMLRAEGSCVCPLIPVPSVSGVKEMTAVLSEPPQPLSEIRDAAVSSVMEEPAATSIPQRQSWGNRPDQPLYASFIQYGKAPILQRLSRRAQAYRQSVRGSWDEIVPWIRSGLPKSQKPTRRAFNVLLSFMLLIAIFTCFVGSGIGLASDYFSLKSLATNGLAALERVPEDLGLGNHTLSAKYITNKQRALAAGDVAIALHDFQELHQRLVQPDPALAAAMHAPRVGTLLRSAFLLSGVALDSVQIVQQMFPTIAAFADVYVSSPLTNNAPSNQGDGALSMQDLTNLQQNVQNAMPYVADLIMRLHDAPPSILFAALSASQQAKLAPFLQLIPQIPTLMPLLQQFLPAAPAILGINQPAAYLITTLDPAEMRATGGFQGNYAIMEMRAGRPGSLSLQDVYLLDTPFNQTAAGANNTPPAPYLTWWPSSYLPWGLRDANLSPNFPTSAAYDLQELALEKGAYAPVTDSHGNVIGKKHVTVTGVIAIEPAVIQQMLTLTGPITIPAPYNDVVTADNLQDKIHYYQLTNKGRKLGTQTGKGDTISSANKRFTALLAKTLMARFRALPKDRLLTFAGMLLQDLHTHAIQVAFVDPAAENFLRYYQISSELYTGNADSLMLVDTNISGNKGSQFLHEQITDQVQLDAKGGATHTMTITYTWAPPPIENGTDPNQVYSVLYDAESDANFGLFYRQFVRIYTAQHPIVQSASNWQFGGIDTTASDVPGRGMLGAFYILQGDATTHPVSWIVPNPTVSWYVPNVYTPGQIYALHFQHQADALLSVTVTVTGPQCGTQPPVTQTFTADPVTTDAIFQMPVPACNG
jgi:hypothetical protein